MNPKKTPIKTEKRISKMKNPNCLPITLYSFSLVATTSAIVVNKIRATASLNSPSPKMIENKTGYSEYFTKVTAAIISELHNSEAR